MQTTNEKKNGDVSQKEFGQGSGADNFAGPDISPERSGVSRGILGNNGCLRIEYQDDPDILKIIAAYEEFFDLHAISSDCTPEIIIAAAELKQARTTALLNGLNKAIVVARELTSSVGAYFYNAAEGDPDMKNPGLRLTIDMQKNSLAEILASIFSAFQPVKTDFKTDARGGMICMAQWLCVFALALSDYQNSLYYN